MDELSWMRKKRHGDLGSLQTEFNRFCRSFSAGFGAGSNKGPVNVLVTTRRAFEPSV